MLNAEWKRGIKPSTSPTMRTSSIDHEQQIVRPGTDSRSQSIDPLTFCGLLIDGDSISEGDGSMLVVLIKFILEGWIHSGDCGIVAIPAVRLRRVSRVLSTARRLFT